MEKLELLKEIIALQKECKDQEDYEKFKYYGYSFDLATKFQQLREKKDLFKSLYSDAVVMDIKKEISNYLCSADRKGIVTDKFRSIGYSTDHKFIRLYAIEYKEKLVLITQVNFDTISSKVVADENLISEFTKISKDYNLEIIWKPHKEVPGEEVGNQLARLIIRMARKDMGMEFIPLK